jgi:hypothetical protein
VTVVGYALSVAVRGILGGALVGNALTPND